MKNEERWVGESLERTLRCADKVVLFDDHSTDETVLIARKFGDRVKVIESPFEGLDEARDKTHLLRAVLGHGATWVLFIDGDEVLTKKAVVEVGEIVKTGAGGIYFFRIAYLWDSPDRERVDGVFGRAGAPRMFSMFDQANRNMNYQTTRHGGNLHCGQVPHGYRGHRRDALAPIKHYGYMLEADRTRKHAWYNKTDSLQGRVKEGNYDHIIGTNRIAPGPIQFREFIDD